MGKNSFTLLETLVSITFLLIVIGGFTKSFYNNEKDEEIFMILNELENKFNTKNYSSFSKSSNYIIVIKNKTTFENISVSKYQFENENIKLFKYEK